MPLTTITKLGSIGTLAILMVSPSFAAPQDEGRWSSVINWPTQANKSLLTPQGNVMSITSGQLNIWNPELGNGSESHSTLTNPSGNTSSRSSVVLIPETGKVLIAGGGSATGGTKDLQIFDPQSNNIQAITDLNHAHFAPATTVLPSGEILLSSDFDSAFDIPTIKINEVFSPASNQTRSLVPVSDNFAISGLGLIRPSRQWVTPMGKIAGVISFVPDRMFSYDTEDQSIEIVEGLPEKFDFRSVEVMYEPGKILNVNNPRNLETAFRSDINSVTPWMVETATRPLTRPRNTSTIAVLPNGKVMIAGGGSPSEVWNPKTEEWSLLATSTLDSRSTPQSILLKDGRVLLASDVEAKVEIFSPPYLFNNSGQEAVRPVIVNAPDSVAYLSEVTVQHQSVNAISRVTLIKTGQSQHQRFMELDFETINGGVKVKMPEYATVATPGYYLMYLLDTEGVPSEGHIIKISKSVETGGAYPVAIADTGSSDGSAVSLNVLSNDTGSGLSLVEVNQYSEQGGTARVSSNQIVFTPKAGFSGTDAFWYVMQDSQGRKNAAKVTVLVTAVGSNIYPTATTDIVNASGSGSITIDALANDSGSGLTLNAPNAWSLRGGNVALVSNKITYKPKAGFNGEDKIWYSFSDSQGRGNSGVIIITVSGNNGSTSPYPTSAQDNVTTTTATSTTIDVLANDTGDGLVLNTPNAWSLNGGKVALVSNKLVYQSKAGFTGSDNIWYTFVDSQGRGNSGQVNITVNSGGGSSAYPVANADYYTTTKNTGQNLNILANDTGGDYVAIDTLYEYTAKGGTSYKTPQGQVWYTPKTGFTGEDNFWYVMIDSEGRKNSAQVKITVTQ